MNIAILEDDRDHSFLVQTWVELAGHTASPFYSNEEFKQHFIKTNEVFDAYLVDWRIKQETSSMTVEWIRERFGLRPLILIITGDDSESVVIEALTKGADDFIVKPIRMGEMLARLQACARRHKSASNERRLNNLTMRLDSRQVFISNVEIKLTETEFQLLDALVRGVEIPQSRVQLHRSIWGQTESSVGSRIVDIYISRLRTKLVDAGLCCLRIETISGYGYKLKNQDECSCV